MVGDKMSDNFYQELLDEGADICELLRGNSGNVGDIGELLQIAADVIDNLSATPLLCARPADEWHEDLGPAIWWSFPIEEPPFCGTPNDSDWPGGYTHWSPIPIPVPA